METTGTASSASYTDIYPNFSTNGQLSIRLYDKRDDFNFAIIHFPHIDSKIYQPLSCMVLLYARPCSCSRRYTWGLAF